MRLIFDKEKTAYKIEFVDDINFKITYTDPKKKTHVYQGEYQNYKSKQAGSQGTGRYFKYS